MVAERAFPVVYAADVSATAAFYERLGFERHFQLPEEGDPGYVGLRRGTYEFAVCASEWPALAAVTDPEGNPVALAQAG